MFCEFYSAIRGRPPLHFCAAAQKQTTPGDILTNFHTLATALPLQNAQAFPCLTAASQLDSRIDGHKPAHTELAPHVDQGLQGPVYPAVPYGALALSTTIVSEQHHLISRSSRYDPAFRHKTVTAVADSSYVFQKNGLRYKVHRSHLSEV